MIVVIHQAEHIPWLGYFDKMLQSDLFVVLDNVQFTKNNFQNRNRIIDQNLEPHWLSVPVKIKNHLDKSFCEIKICYDHNWQKRYLGKLYHCYSKKKNFSLYIDVFEKIIFSNHETIFDLNMSIINFFRDIFNIKTKMILASTLKPKGNSSELLLDICKKLDAKVYLSGSGGKNYLKENIFTKEGILVNYQSFNHPLYKQTDFRYYLSSIDWIFSQEKKL
jgi:hypothetical protein